MTKTETVIIIRENPSSAVAAYTLGGLAAEELLERIIKKLEELGGKENDKKRMEG